MLDPETPPAEPQSTEPDRKSKLREAYTAATSRLRQAHQDEFNTYYSEEAASRGETWTPRLSEEQKAQQEIARLVKENPGLVEFFEAEVAKVKGSAKG